MTTVITNSKPIIVTRNGGVRRIVVSPTVAKIGGQGLQGPKGADGAGQVAPIAFSFGDASPKIIYTLPANGTLVDCSVVIDTPFDGASPSLQLGTTGSPGEFISASEIAPQIAAEFATSPAAVLAAGTNIFLTIIPGFGCTQGAGRVFLTILES